MANYSIATPTFRSDLGEEALYAAEADAHRAELEIQLAQAEWEVQRNVEKIAQIRAIMERM